MSDLLRHLPECEFITLAESCPDIERPAEFTEEQWHRLGVRKCAEGCLIRAEMMKIAEARFRKLGLIE